MDKTNKALSRRNALGLMSGAGTLAMFPSSAIAQDYKTPGVYTVEQNAFPNSVVQVPTSIAAFVGHTEKAEYEGQALIGSPTPIRSLNEFHAMFGAGPPTKFKLVKNEDSGEISLGAEGSRSTYDLSSGGTVYGLYDAVRMFFINGGSDCVIVSTGSYNDDITVDGLQSGVTALEKQETASILVVPDTARLSEEDASTVNNAMLAHCGNMQSRFAILDLVNGDQPLTNDDSDPVTKFRNGIHIDNRSYGTAYYPWLSTTLHDVSDITYEALMPASRKLLAGALALDIKELLADKTPLERAAFVGAIAGPQPVADVPPMPHPASERVVPDEYQPAAIHKALLNLRDYKSLIQTMTTRMNIQPPSGAMAGVYASVDSSQGVWKAPANVSVAGIVGPTVSITHEAQEDLNVPLNGMAVNAIRSFPTRGTLVWGARTLDGNSLDWRYISVRRTMIMLEQSIITAIRAYVFAPNDANTWVAIKGMVSSFLTEIWKQGGLAGATPDYAFSVHVGLGSTMTAVDILDGMLRVTVLVAVTRPAEFIEITFQQKMQQS
ncbi:MAG: phage tail sheath subtilisin-like domain-containing protein [Henriciella sp.]|nr:phage tail sheath subtilisin-like domain-containing protein [Henriciella sp.]